MRRAHSCGRSVTSLVNFAMSQFKAIITSERAAHIAGTSRNGKSSISKRAICDDYDRPSRTVGAFDKWYADEQLEDFMRKYPITRKIAPFVKKKALVESDPQRKLLLQVNVT